MSIKRDTPDWLFPEIVFTNQNGEKVIQDESSRPSAKMLEEKSRKCFLLCHIDILLCSEGEKKAK